MIDLLLIRPNDIKNIYGELSALTSCEPPLWAAIIAAYVREKHISVQILDTEALNLSPKQTIERIKAVSPKLIGLIVSGVNLSASTQKMNGASILASKIKQFLNTPVFMWGLHSSALPEETMASEQIDYVIKGEGLRSIYLLIEYLKHQDNLDAIEGLYYREKDVIKGNPKINITNINDMPMPAWDLLPMNKYITHNWHMMGSTTNAGFGMIATSLGCPFKCTFCAISAMFDERRVRYKAPERVIAEIDELVIKYNVHYLKVMDECFVLNMEHVNAICDLLIERDYNLNIWAYARIDTLQKADLSKLFRAGFKWLSVGVESGNEKSKLAVGKNQYTNQMAVMALKAVRDAGINVINAFMFGLPEDDMEGMEATLELARNINPEFPSFYCTMAYPGSELYNDFKLNSPQDLPKTYLGYAQLGYECKPLPTRYLSAKEVLEFRDYAFNAFFKDNRDYFDNIMAKFGKPGVDTINSMLSKSHSRKLLEV